MTARTVERRWATLPEGARYVGVTTRTLWRWRSRGLLTVYRAGPHLQRVDLNELDAIIKLIPKPAA